MEHYINVFKKYAVFGGRASRAEYWWFFLFHCMIVIALFAIGMIFGDRERLLVGAYGIVVFLPNIALIFRRLHDTNRSGAWILINIIPFVGVIWFLLLMLSSGDGGSNKYGQAPQV